MVALRTRAVCADLWLAGFGPAASANWEVPFWSLEHSFGLIGGELRGISATRRSCLFCYSRLTSAASCVLPEGYEPAMPQAPIRGPLHKLKLPHELGLQPSALGHLRRR